MEKSVTLAEVAPELHLILTVRGEPSPVFARSAIRRETMMTPMRDGVRLATDLYCPIATSLP